jgi:hypothetical protein
MKLFSCSHCEQVLFFENVQCARCGHMLGYLPDRSVLSALEPARDEQGLYRALAPEAGEALYKMCGNYARHSVCNWMLPAGSPESLCESCRLNRVIPNLSNAGALAAWQQLEVAKRRLLFTLFEFKLPVEAVFAFEQDQPGQKIFTGHNEGLITINVAETEDAFREKMRSQMGESYRTLLGHFRHEIGHYYWDRLINDTPLIEEFRKLFGDEQQNYAEAQQRHYQNGPPGDWQNSFVSAYASMHPWEDWAETFAHTLHMFDTIETARSYGLALRPKKASGVPVPAVDAVRTDPNRFEDLISAWFPLTLAVNSLNRSMGLADLYPFVLSERAIEKLRFVHDVLEKGPDLAIAKSGPSDHTVEYSQT